MLAHFLSVAALKLAVVAQIKTEGGSVVIAVDASQDAGFMIGQFSFPKLAALGLEMISLRKPLLARPRLRVVFDDG